MTTYSGQHGCKMFIRVTYYCSDGKVFFCKWNENSIIKIGSSFLTDESVQSVKRRVKLKSNGNVAQPFLVKEHNSRMDGGNVLYVLIDLL